MQPQQPVNTSTMFDATNPYWKQPEVPAQNNMNAGGMNGFNGHNPLYPTSMGTSTSNYSNQLSSCQAGAQDMVTGIFANVDRNYICLYMCAIIGFCLFWYSFQDIGLSTLITVAVLIQVIALAAMLLGILGRKSVKGISARSMLMQAISFFLRLCSTCWLKGYIPVDSTGDWLYQIADITAFVLCCQIVYLIYYEYRHTYQEAEDTFPVKAVVGGCIVLAALVHPDLNNRPFFDGVWTAALYVDVVSTLPQLWMIGRLGGKVEALSAHYVALIAVSRSIDAIFWYHGFEELAPENGSFNLAGWTVFGAHILHILLMWDFIYCYGKSIYKGKLLDKQFDFGDMIIDV